MDWESLNSSPFLGSTFGDGPVPPHASVERRSDRRITSHRMGGPQYLEAAAAFTEALDYVESHSDPAEASLSSSMSSMSSSSSLNKQIVTLINNRSAMYEKGNFPELAVEDCNRILDVYDIGHSKARQRKLRILETKFKDYYQALVECCALQLLYMQQHRDQLRMGLPASSPPPVPQAKLEELVQQLLPGAVDEYYAAAAGSADKRGNPQLPSDYTLGQLLKSFTGYNSWMAKAARDGSVATLKKQLADLPAPPAKGTTAGSGVDPTVAADTASLWMRIGRRHVYDGDYALGREAILTAYVTVDGKADVQAVMRDDDYPRLLEWAGMVKHWAYELDEAEACYHRYAELEPLNVSTRRIPSP